MCGPGIRPCYSTKDCRLEWPDSDFMAFAEICSKAAYIKADERTKPVYCFKNQIMILTDMP